MKIRVHDLAERAGVPSSDVVARLGDLGEYVKGPSSSVELPVAQRLLRAYGKSLEDHPLQAADRTRAPREPQTPPSLETGWSAGAVRAPTSADLQRNVERLERAFPTFRQHKNAINQLGSQVVYAGFSKDKNVGDCGVALIRFSGAIEAAFGLTREVLAFYSPHRDLQVRTYEAALAQLRSIGREVTPDLLFLSAPDPRLGIKLDDWAKFPIKAVPLALEMPAEALAFIGLIRDYIYSRDLFYETTPVRGARFFGRKTLLQSLRDDVLNQRVSGVFGLRKAGKTSVMLQLSDIMAAEGIVPVFLDLEAFPSPPDDPTSEIVAELRRQVLEAFRERKLRTKELADLGEEPSIVAFKTALQQLLKHSSNSGTRVLLMLDEIEYLTPSDKIDIAEGPMPRVAQLLSALRSLVQETSNFTFMLSGLTSAIIESGRLYGRPNPLFSWAKSYYVGPLESPEADELARSTGLKMGIEFEAKALEALYEASGGHAFLYRNLASNVVEALPMDVYRRVVTKSLVLTRQLEWKDRVAGNISEMIQHVGRYYPTESVMLEILRESPGDFSDIAKDEPLALRHLTDLGLIHREKNSEYELNSLLDLL